MSGRASLRPIVSVKEPHPRQILGHGLCHVNNIPKCGSNRVAQGLQILSRLQISRLCHQTLLVGSAVRSMRSAGKRCAANLKAGAIALLVPGVF